MIMIINRNANKYHSHIRSSTPSTSEPGDARNQVPAGEEEPLPAEECDAARCDGRNPGGGIGVAIQPHVREGGGNDRPESAWSRQRAGIPDLMPPAGAFSPKAAMRSPTRRQLHGGNDVPGWTGPSAGQEENRPVAQNDRHRPAARRIRFAARNDGSLPRPTDRPENRRPLPGQMALP